MLWALLGKAKLLIKGGLHPSSPGRTELHRGPRVSFCWALETSYSHAFTLIYIHPPPVVSSLHPNHLLTSPSPFISIPRVSVLEFSLG
jgi:hypothetical protein